MMAYRRSWAVVACGLASVVGACGGGSPQLDQTIFFVSPLGNDAADGSESHPFASLEHARDVVRAARTRASSDLIIELHAGVYSLPRTLTLGPADSGPVGHRTIYRAHAGEAPILSGGISIAGWTEGNDGLWSADLAVDGIRQLTVGGTRASRARGDASPQTTVFGSFASVNDIGGFDTPDPAPTAWGNPTDVELGFFGSWTHRMCGVAAIAPGPAGGARFTLRQPCAFWAVNADGEPIDLPAYIENAKELIDQPGEWYFDRVARRVWYRPRPGEVSTQVLAVAPVLETLVNVQGTFDDPVHDLLFQGITFADAGWMRPSAPLGNPDIQANIVPDPDPAHAFVRDGRFVNVHNESLQVPGAVTVASAHAVRFERCDFTRLGPTGLFLGVGAQDNTVIGCKFHMLGGTAIEVGGIQRQDHHPDDPRLIVRGNSVVDNDIRDIGMDWEGSVAVFVGYTDGTVVAHNEIARIPYSAISVGWGWGEEDPGGGVSAQPFLFDTPTTAANNRIEWNHIHDHMQLRSDGGGIYTLTNMPGTVIRGNLVHDASNGPGGVYMDLGSGFIEVSNNVVFNVPEALHENNQPQDRLATCNVHDNALNIGPGDSGYLPDVAAQAGLESGYQDLLSP